MTGGKSPLELAREAPGSTKGRILAAAEAVFAARGFEGASTREIASQAGVNISSLHYHWASKDALYVAVFQDVFDRLTNLLRGTLGSSPRSGAARSSSRASWASSSRSSPTTRRCRSSSCGGSSSPTSRSASTATCSAPRGACSANG
jgi:AcrR family transcriptional regulator